MNLDDIIIDSRLTQSKNGKIRKNKDCEKNKPTSEQKWWVSLLIGLIFGFISSPLFYNFTNHIFNFICGSSMGVELYVNKVCYNDYSECIYGGATLLGLIIHTVIFTLIIRFLLW